MMIATGRVIAGRFLGYNDDSNIQGHSGAVVRVIMMIATARVIAGRLLWL